MTPLVEIISEILWFIVAIGLMGKAYFANKSAKPFPLSTILNAGTDEAVEGFPAMFIAVGFLIGIAMLILLANKFLTCGFICGTLFP